MNKVQLNTRLSGSLEITLYNEDAKRLGVLKINKGSLAFRKAKAHTFRRIRYEHLSYVFEMHGVYNRREE